MVIFLPGSGPGVAARQKPRMGPFCPSRGVRRAGSPVAPQPVAPSSSGPELPRASQRAAPRGAQLPSLWRARPPPHPLLQSFFLCPSQRHINLFNDYVSLGPVSQLRNVSSAREPAL